jgi:hypothetical protein
MAICLLQRCSRPCLWAFWFLLCRRRFFFISGLIAGSLLATKPHLILGNLNARLAKLYLANLMCVALLAACAYFAPNFFSQWGILDNIRPLWQHPVQATLFTSLFLFLPGFFDILPVYCLFFMLIPLMFRLIETRRLSLLLSGSLGLWVLGQFGLLQKISHLLSQMLPLVSLGWFDIFSWQLLFVVAVVAGYYFRQGSLEGFLKPSRAVMIGIAIFCAVCLVVRHNLSWQAGLATFIDVRTLGPLRLVNFLLATYLTTIFLRKTQVLHIPALALLGRWSLRVFLYHCCLVYVVGTFTHQIAELSTSIQIGVFTLAILSLWLPALFDGYMAKFRKSLVIDAIN